MLDSRAVGKTKNFNKTLTVTRTDERTIRKSEAAEALWRRARPEQNLSWVSTCCSEQFKLCHKSTNTAITKSMWTATCKLFFHALLLQNMEVWLSGYVSQIQRTNSFYQDSSKPRSRNTDWYTFTYGIQGPSCIYLHCRLVSWYIQLPVVHTRSVVSNIWPAGRTHSI